MTGAAAPVLTVPAPAKLNLFLHVTGRRDDGYHLLESLMVFIDLADTVRIESRADGSIDIPSPLAGVAVEDDLAWRAARALQQHSKVPHGATIRVAKQVPMGAGLGGGSSDAASVLLALNRLWGLGLPRAELMRIALELGADVPFFVFGSNARATGIGEILERVTVPRTEFLLAMPSVPVATASVFAAPELVRDTPQSGGQVFAAGFGRNDLQPVALSRNPSIGAALSALDQVPTVPIAGWPDHNVRMSGSGAALFKPGWPAADDRVHENPGLFRLIKVRTLACHPLRDFVEK